MDQQHRQEALTPEPFSVGRRASALSGVSNRKELRPLDGRQARANTGTPSRRGDQNLKTPPRPGCWVMCLREVLPRLLPNPGLSGLSTSNTMCYTVFGCEMFSMTSSCNPAVCTDRVLLPILD